MSYSCSACQQSFTRKDNLQRHLNGRCLGKPSIEETKNIRENDDSIQKGDLIEETTTINRKFAIKSNHLKIKQTPDSFDSEDESEIKNSVEHLTQQIASLQKTVKEIQTNKNQSHEMIIKSLQPDTTDESIGYIYFGRKYLYLIKALNFFKIGITEELNPLKRLNAHNSLGKNHDLKLIIKIQHVKSTEKNLKKIFQTLFGNPIDGTETFEGDQSKMISIIYQYINYHNLYC